MSFKHIYWYDSPILVIEISLKQKEVYMMRLLRTALVHKSIIRWNPAGNPYFISKNIENLIKVILALLFWVFTLLKIERREGWSEEVSLNKHQSHMNSLHLSCLYGNIPKVGFIGKIFAMKNEKKWIIRDDIERGCLQMSNQVFSCV